MQHIRLFKTTIKDLLDCAMAECDGTAIGYIDEAMQVVEMLCESANDGEVSELNFD